MSNSRCLDKHLPGAENRPIISQSTAKGLHGGRLAVGAETNSVGWATQRRREMAKKLRQISCDPACGFMVQSHDEMEVLKMAREHAKKNHKELKVTDAGLKKMMKLV